MKVPRREGLVIYPGKPIEENTCIKRVYHYTSLNSFFKIWLSKSLLFADVHRMNDMLENNYSCCSNSLNIDAMDLYLEKRGEYKQISLNCDYDTYTLGCMSPAMWGHYGDSGKGVCIELDFDKLKANFRDVILHDKIDYLENLRCPSFIGQVTTNNIYDLIEKHQKEVFFTKHSSWAYENEYRLVSRIEEKLSIKGAITSIYLTKCNTPEAEMVIELLKDDNDVYLEYVDHSLVTDLKDTMMFRIDDVVQGMKRQKNNKRIITKGK